MKNIQMTREGDTLTIKIDLTKRGNKSTSGKSISIASTGGNVSVEGPEGIKLGVNCYVPVGE